MVKVGGFGGLEKKGSRSVRCLCVVEPTQLVTERELKIDQMDRMEMSERRQEEFGTRRPSNGISEGGIYGGGLRGQTGDKEPGMSI